MTDGVTIVVDGVVYGGWKSVRIESSIDQVARAFALSVTDQFPGNSNFMRIRPGSAVQLFIGDDLVCTGYITAVPVRYDAKNVSVTVQGKSRTVDLVDCCPAVSYQSGSGSEWSDVKSSSDYGAQVQAPASENSSWTNAKTVEIIAALAAPYGISVFSDGDLGTKVANYTVTPGETVFEAINRILTKDNLIVTDDEAGNLVIWNAENSAMSKDALILGENVLSGQCGYDLSSRFSDYVVLGQHAGSDDDFGRSAAEDRGTANDPEVGRIRLKVIKNEGQGSSVSCAQRALFESQYRRAQSLKVSYTVRGWRQSSGELWRAGMMVQVHDEFMEVESQLLVVKVTYSLSAQGMLTTLDLIRRLGYKREASKSGTKSTGESWSDVC